MAKVSVTATVKTQATLTPKLKTELLTTVKAYGAQKLIRDAADEKMKKARTRTEEIMETAGETALEVEGYKTTLVAPVRRTLSVERLLKKGVSIDVINACYEETPGTPYVKIHVPGQKAD